MQPILGPNQSLEDGGSLTVSELVLLRIPVAAGSQLLEASTTAGTAQPQRSHAPQHHAFVRSIAPHPLGLTIEVYPVVSFTHEGGAVNGYNAANETLKQSLIPLPPLSRPPNSLEHHFSSAGGEIRGMPSLVCTL